jgi:hypothetical protein
MNDIEDDNIITWAQSYEACPDIEDEIALRVEEARAQYPAEDCLSDVIEQVRQLNVKGANLELKFDILQALENKQKAIFYAAEHGISELDKLMGVLNNG